jgi:hypothetical protein
MSVNENVLVTLDEERPAIPPRRLQPIPEDKLHRVSISFFSKISIKQMKMILLQRNPHTVRQEIQMFNDELISETSLADVHLSEMPGLHNTGC